MKINDCLAGYEAGRHDAETHSLPDSYIMRHASARYRLGYGMGQQDYALGARDLSK